MSIENSVRLIGNLGDDPNVTTTKEGLSVCKFSLATTERRKDSSGNRKDKTSWHRVVAFGKLSDLCGEYLSKGSKIAIEGRISYSEHTGDDGQKRYYTDIIADQMQMLGGRGESGGSAGGDRGGSTRGAPSRQQANRGAQPGSAQKATISEYEAGGFDDDDIPFN